MPSPNDLMDDRGTSPLVLAAGLTAAAAGATGVFFSWSYYDLRLQYREPIEAGESRYHPQYVAEGKNAALLNIGGAALLISSLPILLPDYDDAPILPWLAGGIGLTAAALGTYYTATGHACTPAGCNPGGPDVYFGPLLLGTASPFLAVPLVYAIREWLGSGDTTAAITPTLNGVTVGLSGRY